MAISKCNKTQSKCPLRNSINWCYVMKVHNSNVWIILCIYRHIPPMPGLTPTGRRVVVLRARNPQHQLTQNIYDGMKLALMIGDIRLKEEQTGVAGDVYVLDASVASPYNFAKFTPALVKKFLVCVQVRHYLLDT